MRIVYGIEVRESNDVYIATAERAMNSMIETAIPGSFIFTMLFLPLYAVVAPLIGFSQEYQGIVPRLWTDAVFYFTLLLVPMVCLARDFVWK